MLNGRSLAASVALALDRLAARLGGGVREPDRDADV